MIRPVEYEGLEELEEGGGRLLPAPLIRPRPITTEKQLAEMVEFYSDVDEFAFDCETLGETKADKLNPLQNEVFWLSFATAGRVDAIPMRHPHGRMLVRSRKVKLLPPLADRRVLQNGELSKSKVSRVLPDEFAPPPTQLRPSVVFKALEPLFFSDRRKVGQNVKFDIKSVAKYYGHRIMPGPFGETFVTAHLLDDRRTRADLATLARDLLGITDYPKLGKIGVENFSINAATRYVCQDASYTWAIHEWGMAQLKALRLDRVWNMEMDLIEAIIRMEVAGALVDEDALGTLRDALHIQLEDIEAQIYVYNGGRAFNLNANADKIKFLFTPKKDGGRGLRPITRTAVKNDPRVDDATLQHYAEQDPAVALMVEWGDVKKMVSTYADSWYERMVEGRLRADFVQFGARTGRLSCREPNLQNVPRADTELGKRVRDLIVAPPGFQLVVADYDQIELRVIAHFSRDPTMVRTFEEGTDIHAATASLLLGRTVPSKGDPARQLGKNVNFATSFGAGPAKVAAMCAGSGYPLAVKQKDAEAEAKRFLKLFDERFRAVDEFKRDVVRTAKRERPPAVKTILGRVRLLPELFYEDWELRGKAERQAVNTRVQGSAADIMKLAMVKLDRTLLREVPDARLVLTVHDELVIETPNRDVEAVKELAVMTMSGITLRGEPILSVPLRVACDSAERWSDAK